MEKQRQRMVNAAKGNHILREMEKNIFAFISGGNVSDTSAVIAETVKLREAPVTSEWPSLSTVSLHSQASCQGNMVLTPGQDG